MNAIKKLSAIILSFAMLISMVTAVSADEEYKEAERITKQSFSIENMGDGTYNILKNGSFEGVESNGTPDEWGISGCTVGESFMVAKGDAADGKNFSRIYGETSSAMISYLTTQTLPDTEYLLKAKVRRISGKGEIIIRVANQYPSGTTFDESKQFNKTCEIRIGKSWTDIEMPVKTDETTARVIILLRLIGGGEVHFDDIKLIGKVSKEMELSSNFSQMLEEEKALDDSTTKMEERDLHSFHAPYPGQENIIENGSFDETDENGKLKAWGLRSDFTPFVSIAKGEGVDGSNCAKYVIDGSKDGAKHPFYNMFVPLVGGAEYQVQFKYKVIEGIEANPAIKFEYWTGGRGLPGVRSNGEKYCHTNNEAPKLTESDLGVWRTLNYKIYPAITTKEANVLVRLMQNNPVEKIEVLIDDVKIYMTTPPAALKLESNRIFFYTDQKDGKLIANINEYFPELYDATIDYAILDGTEVIWESRGQKCKDGKGEAEFDTSILKEKEKLYRARATVYSADGKVHTIDTQNIFMYDRPEYLGDDGKLRKDSFPDDYYPIFGYHVTKTTENYEKVSEAGINLIQAGSWSTAETIKAELDKLEASGIKALIVLYENMNPAGHESNIENTILNVSIAKDHPATYAYIVMDEVFTSRADPEPELEASYRLIRSIDKKHPVTVMEASKTFYATAAKYVDLLLIDPYSKAAGMNASISTDIAREALYYEKPVYSLLAAYNQSGWYNTADDVRNNNWQALITGATAVGYYSINDSDVNPETGKFELPIWDATDGGAMWKGLVEFAEKERDIAFKHFVRNETPEFNESRQDELWYSSWVDGNDVYMIVLGLKESGEQAVSIPLTSFAGDITIGDYTATLIAGREDAETVTGSETLDITVSGVEALLYKITPAGTVDFSSLKATSFEDLENHNWARQQIAQLAASNVITGRNDYSYAPADMITRSEFAGFLIRALGLTADSTELFADVSADDEFAKEIAIGKALGILKGTDGVNYNPNAAISRQDLMVICARGMRLVKEMAAAGEMNFPDAGGIADYAKEDVAAMVSSGIIKGNADGTINPLGNTTRAEAAVIMSRIVAWK